MNGAGVLAVAANQDQSGSQFLMLLPVIMRGGYRVEWSFLHQSMGSSMAMPASAEEIYISIQR